MPDLPRRGYASVFAEARCVILAAGWLCVDGVELVNHARTLTYLRNGLAGANWEVAASNVGTVSGYVELPYDDEYVPEYFELVTHDCADGFIPLCLECVCAGMVAIDETFVDPASDEAPWYVAAKPASADFLGVLLDDIDDRPPTTRSMVKWASGGAGVSAWSPSERTAGFTATLVAATPAGMEWGRRWVSDVLIGGLCGQEASEVTFLPGCPDDGDDPALAYRRYARVVLIDPPRFTAVEDVPECEVMEARWQIAAGVPWLLSVPDLDDTTTVHPASSESFTIESDDWNGDVAGLVRIEAGATAATVAVEAYPVPDGETCPIPGTPNPCHAVTMTVAPYGVVEIDSATEDAVYYNPTTKQPEPAWSLFDFDGPWSWLTVPPCSTVCVVVTNDGPGAVEVNAVGVVREA